MPQPLLQATAAIPSRRAQNRRCRNSEDVCRQKRVLFTSGLDWRCCSPTGACTYKVVLQSHQLLIMDFVDKVVVVDPESSAAGFGAVEAPLL